MGKFIRYFLLIVFASGLVLPYLNTCEYSENCNHHSKIVNNLAEAKPCHETKKALTSYHAKSFHSASHCSCPKLSQIEFITSKSLSQIIVYLKTVPFSPGSFLINNFELSSISKYEFSNLELNHFLFLTIPIFISNLNLLI